MRARRAEDVLDMQSAVRRGGTTQLLRWLASRTGAGLVLLDRSGAVARPARSPLSAADHELALRGLREITVRGLGSAVIDQDGRTCVVLPLTGPRGAAPPLLAVVVPQPVAAEMPLLLADATSALSLSWQGDLVRQQQHRLRIADARTREAVLHLLMNGQAGVARQVAGALRPALPELVRVYVIEGPSAVRGTVADQLARAFLEAWIVPCPVYADHMLVLAPVDAGERAPGAGLLPPAVADTCWLGASDAVPLRDVATGYGQAFHALAAARERPERQASFAGNPDLALTLGPAALPWADAFLAPLRSHAAGRPQDPDSAELLATAASWISFASRAAAHLKIHRNTLAARLSRIQELLRLDLSRLAGQSALALALRTTAAPVRSAPQHGSTALCLDELLLLPGVATWARRQFGPVRAPDVPTAVAETLGTWLDLDARIGPTAATLSLSPSAVRKRLTRCEALLERSLLRPPTAVHELWLARRALELAPQPA